MKENKVRNLPPIWLKIPVDDLNKPEVLQMFDDAQRCGFTAIRLPAKHGVVRVTFTVMRPQGQQAEDDLALFSGEPEEPAEELADLLKPLAEGQRGEHP